MNLQPLRCLSTLRTVRIWVAAAAGSVLLIAPVRADSTITVNSSADGVVIDGALTLREAMILGGWSPSLPYGGNPGKVCFTAAEKAQVTGDGAGCFVVASPVLLGCEYNPLVETRYVANNNCFGFESGPGFGRNDTDRVAFSPAISTIVSDGVLQPARYDTLDGALPGGGRVRILFSDFAALNPAIYMVNMSYGVEPEQIRIRNLEIEGFTADCIVGLGVRDSEFTNLLLRLCGQNGIRLSSGSRNPSGNKIGGGAGLGNEIREMFEYGIRIEGSAALLDAAVPNLIQGNRIGWSLAAPASALGNSLGGIAIVNSALTEIGSTGATEVNRISGNGGPGIHLYGSRTQQTEVFGNYIGTIDPAGSWIAKPNGAGIVVEAGANNNDIGGATAARRNVIAGNTGHGIRLWGESDFNTVRGNRVGLDPTGGSMPNAGDGVRMEGPASQNQVFENLVSANAGVGIHITGAGADSNIVDLNAIGLDTSQSLDRGNASHGVQIDSGAKNNRIGSAANLGNHIAGNDNDGIHIQGVGTDGNEIYGNLVGLDFNRFNAVPNSWGGVTLLFGAKNNVIGTLGAGNTLSGNGVVGVYLFGTGTSQNSIRGNRIGLSAGDGAIGNAQGGIRILADADLNTIEGNVVAGNGGPGIELLGPGLAGGEILSNLIGRDAADLVDRPNLGAGIRLADGVLGAEITDNVLRANAGPGIYLGGAGTSGTLVQGNTVHDQTGAGILIDGASGNVIGNLSPLQPNDVRQNGGFAVQVLSGTSNPIRGNILRDSLRAIALGGGLPPNDPFDVDAGPNLLQNFPIPFNAQIGENSWALQWGLMSAPSTSYAIDFYTGTCDFTGRGLARQHLGSVTIVTDARGLFRGTEFFLGAPPVHPDVFLAATDPSANSSELSPCLPLADTQRILVDGFESGYLDGWTDWNLAAPGAHAGPALE